MHAIVSTHTPQNTEDLQCPISLELLSEGVVCEDGYTYQVRMYAFAWAVHLPIYPYGWLYMSHHPKN